MGISDRLLGKTNVNGKPHIEAVVPAAALPGGEVRITGHGLRPQDLRRPRVRFGEIEGAVVISSDEFLVARVPPGASSGPIVVSTNGHSSNPHQIKVAVPIAENLHPVTNPALDKPFDLSTLSSLLRARTRHDGAPPPKPLESWERRRWVNFPGFWQRVS